MPLGLPPKNKLPAKKRAAVKELYQRGLAVSAIADAQGVSRRTISDWAKAGGWERPADRARAEEEDQGQGQARAQQRAIDEPPDIDAILAETINDLRVAMAATIKSYDYRPVSNIAAGIVKCLEAWERRHPATPAALAMLAIEMNTSPEDFQNELFKAWRLGNGND